MVAAVVLAIGSIATRGQQTPASIAVSEQLRRSTLESVDQLAAALPAAGATPAVTGQLASISAVLDTQRAALAGGSETHSAAPAPGATVTPAVPPVPATVPDMVSKLTASAAAATDGALAADGVMARLLAATGAGQLTQARALAAAAGLPVPGPQVPPAPTPPAAAATAAASASAGSGPAAGAAAAVTPSCSARPAPEGLNTGSALSAVAAAEQKAVYAYQVSATRMTNPRSSQAVALLVEHQDALAAAQDELRSSCLPVPKIQPGYQLDPGFTATPAAALAGLETQLTAVYGDLVAFTAPGDGGAALRRGAVTAMDNSALRAAFWGAGPSALPGIGVG
ncbi:MAG: DUF4439 domain-containing protein [Actinomycetales bacterium]